MEPLGTVLIASSSGIEWAVTTETLTEDHGYRVIVVGSYAEAISALTRMVVLAKDGEYLTTQHMSPTLLAVTPRRTLPLNGFVPSGMTLKDKVVKPGEACGA